MSTTYLLNEARRKHIEPAVSAVNSGLISLLKGLDLKSEEGTAYVLLINTMANARYRSGNLKAGLAQRLKIWATREYIDNRESLFKNIFDYKTVEAALFLVEDARKEGNANGYSETRKAFREVCGYIGETFGNTDKEKEKIADEYIAVANNIFGILDAKQVKRMLRTPKPKIAGVFRPSGSLA